MARKKTGVRYLNVNYNVNENKRTVACVLTAGINLDRLAYREMLDGSDNFCRFMSKVNIESWENVDTGEINDFYTFQIVGFAVCDPDDKFDPELGKKIALTRAQQGAFDEAGGFYGFCEDCLLEAANRMAELRENTDCSYFSCKDHANELTGKK